MSESLLKDRIQEAMEFAKKNGKELSDMTGLTTNPIYPDEVLTLEEAEQMIHIVGKVIERSGSV